MRGCDSIIDDPLYMGTAKSAEGYLAAVLFKKAKDEGCKIAVNWQDQDSSSDLFTQCLVQKLVLV